jgi:hypothetical protein
VWREAKRGSRVLLAGNVFRHNTGRIAGKQFLPLLHHLSNVSRRKADMNWKLIEHVKFKHRSVYSISRFLRFAVPIKIVGS